MKKSRTLLLLSSVLLLLSSCSESVIKIDLAYSFRKANWENAYDYESSYFLTDNVDKQIYSFNKRSGIDSFEEYALMMVYGGREEADNAHLGYHFSSISNGIIYFNKDEYTIEYSGYFNIDNINNPQKYTFMEEFEDASVYKLNPLFNYYDLDAKEYIDELPCDNPRNIRLEVSLKEDEVTINYHGLEGLHHSNPTTINLTSGDKDKTFTLKNPTDNIANVTFLGFYTSKEIDKEDLNKDKITTFDPYSGITDIYAHFESEKRTFSFYENGKALSTAEYTFDNRYDVLEKNLPKREGKVCSWDLETISELKNYTVNLIVEDDIFDIALYDIDTQLLIGEYQMRNDESYQLLKAKAPNGKYVVSMYYDIKEEKPVGASDKVKSDNKIYAKLKNIKKISTYEEFLKFYDDPKGSYQLTNDIDFKGAAIKPIASFSGTFDGGGFALKNFNMQNHKNSTNFALFTDNSGTIKNLELSSFTSTNKYRGASNTAVYQGVLTSINNGIIDNIVIKDSISSGLSSGVTQTSVSNENTLSVGLVAALNKGTINDVSLEAASVWMSNTIGYGTYNMGGLAGHHGKIYANEGLVVGKNEGTITNISIDEHSTVTSSVLTFSQNDVVATSSVTYDLGLGILCGTNSGSIKNAVISGNLRQYDSSYVKDSKVKRYLSYAFGGIVGKNTNKVENVEVDETNINIGDVRTGDDTYYPVAGLLVGNNSGTLNKSFATSNAKGNITFGTNHLGGIFGLNSGTITNCYTQGRITASALASELSGIGFKNTGKVEYCYSIATLVAEDREYTNVNFKGGVTNNTSSGKISHCFINPTYTGNGYVSKAYKFGYSNEGTALYCYCPSAFTSDVPEEKWATNEEFPLVEVSSGDFTDSEFIFDQTRLAFNEEIWEIIGNNYPTLKQ